jgi:DNA replication protein DnaC
MIMNNGQSIDKMKQMKLYGMARAMASALDMGLADITPDEFVAHLVDAEWDDRHNRRLLRLIKNAKFRYTASFEEMDFSFERNLSKNMFLRFSDCSFIKDKKNIIITGPTGVGKSYAASALGNQACIYGYRTLYFNLSKLFSTLKLAKADGSYISQMQKIEKADLILLDDFGLQKLDTASRLIFLEILEDRHGIRSTVITSQLPVASWHEVIGDPTIADAICDRMVNSSYRIELKGDSLRKKYGGDSMKR